MRWERAWSPWPGRVEVRGYVLRAQDNDVQWELRVERANADVELPALLDRVVHLTRADLVGVTLRLRPRLARGGADTERDMAMFPPIEGADPGFVPEPPMSMPSALAPTRWEGKLDGVTVRDVREIWVGAWRTTLDGEASGALHVAPGLYRLRVAPSSLVVRQARVRRGDLAVGVVTDAVLRATIDMPDYRTLAGAAFLDCVAASADVTATVDEHILHRPGGIEGIAAGAATVRARLILDAGALLAGSRASIAGDLAVLRVGPLRARGPWSVDVDVPADAAAGVGADVVPGWPRVLARLGPVEVIDAAGTTVASSAAIALDATTSPLHALAAPTLRSLHVEVAPTGPIDLRRLVPPRRSAPFAITSAEARLRAVLDWGPGDVGAHAEVALTIERLGVRAGPQRMHGRADGVLHIRAVPGGGRAASGLFGLDEVDLSDSQIAVAGVRLHGADAAERPWHGVLSLGDARASWRDLPELRARVRGTFSDARPLMALIRQRSGLPAFALRMVDTSGLRVSARLQATQDGATFSDLRIESEDLRGHGEVRLGDFAPRGDALLEIHGVDLGVEFADGEVETHFFGAQSWHRAQRRRRRR